MSTIINSMPGKWKNFCLLLALNMLAAFSFGQVRISGKISSPSGASTESVSITVKGTKSGTVADATGNYSFNAPLTPGNYVLVFTGVGFQEQQIALVVGSEKSYTVNAILTDKISKLDEVVVIKKSISSIPQTLMR